MNQSAHFARVCWIEQRIRSSDHLGHARGVRGDHRSPARHGLQRRQPEPFAERRKDHGFTEAIEVDQVRIGHESRQDHLVGFQAFALGRLEDFVPVVRAHLARDHQLDVLAGRRRRAGESGDQAGDVLARFIGAGVDDEAAAHSITHAKLALPILGNDADAERVLDAQGQSDDLFVADSQTGHDLGLGVIRDRK
ncbi:hypothetical protein D3C73_418510 [compost metagenome]